MTVTLWETEAEMKASDQTSPYFREQVAKLADLLVGSPTQEFYEVVFQE